MIAILAAAKAPLSLVVSVLGLIIKFIEVIESQALRLLTRVICLMLFR